jgi:H+-translocating NAD(P) transhydrogenase subunit alpha
MIHVLEFIFTYRYEIFILILSGFLGIEVISHVPSVLHTPLMSGANAIHGVIIIGGIILLGHADITKISGELILGILVVFFASLNVAGGFVVTDRMLDMFKKKSSAKNLKKES